MALPSWVRTWKRSIELRWGLQQTLRRKAVVRCHAVRLGLEPLEDRFLLSAYVVTSTADDGSGGTLRDGITQANMAGSTITEIDFNVGTAGSAQTINLTSQLPALTANGVFINGLSQGGNGNTKHLMTLNGTNAGSQSDGLLLQGASCTVSGLILSGFTNGIEVAGSKNIIGGAATGAGDVISANAGDGVLIDSGVSGVQVLGNYIGTDTTGDFALGNNNGIVIDGDSNTVGGTASGARNLICGNGSEGVQLKGKSNQVLGNYIGSNAAGNAVLSNGNGIEIDSSSNTVGGSFSRAGNLIAGNGGQGVLINSSGNLVLGNSIGANAAGNTALPNGNGIEIVSSNNTVGGTSPGAGNLISGNGNGIFISNGGDSNLVLGNSIGANAVGNAALANGNGIEIVSSGNTVGGTSPGAGNLISGNVDGILLSSGGDGNQVQGNFIGSDAAGNNALANGTGIVIDSSSNTIGGAASGAGNLISGNSIEGVYISGSSNQVLGDSIGADAAGNAALANKVGIMIDGSSNTVGGASSAARNLISGNSNDGVLLDVFGSDNQVMGNYIGTDVTGAFAVANSVGVELAGASNTLGGAATGAGNPLSGNSGDGVLLDNLSSGNQALGNSIGANASGAALGNGDYGVNISGSNNSIGGSVASAGNIITENTQGGVLVSKGSGNTIRLNSIYANGANNSGPGITLSSGANNDLAAPSLASALINSTTLTVNGSFDASTAKVSYVLNVYANLSGDAEGRVSLGSLTVTPNSTGTQSFTFTTTTTVTGTYPLITATLTDASGNSSSFSNGVTVANGPPQSFPPPNGPLPSSSPPILDVPPLLALINIFFGGGIETVNGNGTETLADSLFGIPLLVSTFDSSGNLMSVSLLGINVTFLFG